MNQLSLLEAELPSVGLAASPCGRCRLTIRRPDRPMIATYAPVWVTCLNNQWFIVPWGGHVYPIASRKALVQACREIIESTESGTWNRSVDSKLELMSLQRLNEERYAEFGRQLYEAQRESPPEIPMKHLCGMFQRKGFVVQTSNQRWAHIAAIRETDQSVRRELWCTIFQNHWYVRTPSGRVYGCEDESIIELCFETLRETVPIRDAFTEDLVAGYSLFEVTGQLKIDIEDQAASDTTP